MPGMKKGSEFTGLQVLEYDSLGRVAQIRYRSAAGIEQICETNSYESGVRVKTRHVGGVTNGPGVTRSFGVEGTDTWYSVNGSVAKVITRYNGNHQLQETSFVDASDGVLSRVQFTYDAAGNLTQEAQTHTKPPIPEEALADMPEAERLAVLKLFGGPAAWRLHRYDEFGRRMESETYFGPMKASSITHRL